MTNQTRPLEGMTQGSRVAPESYFGRGARWVVDASHVQTNVDKKSGLRLFPIAEVYTNTNSVFLGFGVPNVYLTVPNDSDEGWLKFAAFMFWRSRSFVANTKGRVQAGVLIELRGLPAEARSALRTQMSAHEGKRSASCANLNARVLGAAGFTSGGASLRRFVRPSRLARRIWQYGLEWNHQSVDIRVVRTGGSIVEHFTSVWRREATSMCRSVKKKFLRSKGADPAPVFEPRVLGAADDHWQESEHMVEVGISRPSWIGARLSNIFGEKSIFVARPSLPMDDPELINQLPAYPGKLDLMTKIKRYFLFSKPVIWMMRRHLSRDTDFLGVAPARAAVDMLREGKNGERFIYNLVAVRNNDGMEEIRLTRLENQSGQDNRFINWIMAKHVLIAGYHPNVPYACEVWVERDENQMLRIGMNRNSGTYQPTEPRMLAFADYVHRLFGVDVQIYDND